MSKMCLICGTERPCSPTSKCQTMTKEEKQRAYAKAWGVAHPEYHKERYRKNLGPNKNTTSWKEWYEGSPTRLKNLDRTLEKRKECLRAIRARQVEIEEAGVEIQQAQKEYEAWDLYGYGETLRRIEVEIRMLEKALARPTEMPPERIEAHNRAMQYWRDLIELEQRRAEKRREQEDQLRKWATERAEAKRTWEELRGGNKALPRREYKKIWSKAHPVTKERRNAHSNARKLQKRIGKGNQSPEDSKLVEMFYERVRTVSRMKCHWCRKWVPRAEREVDHIVPLAKGGQHILFNLCCSCRKCNQEKSAKAPEEFAGQFELPIGQAR